MYFSQKIYSRNSVSSTVHGSADSGLFGNPFPTGCLHQSYLFGTRSRVFGYPRWIRQVWTEDLYRPSEFLGLYLTGGYDCGVCVSNSNRTNPRGNWTSSTDPVSRVTTVIDDVPYSSASRATRWIVNLTDLSITRGVATDW